MARIKKPSKELEAINPLEYARQSAAYLSDKDPRANVYYEVNDLSKLGKPGCYGINQQFDGMAQTDAVGKMLDGTACAWFRFGQEFTK